jgi:hypothetical protein
VKTGVQLTGKPFMRRDDYTDMGGTREAFLTTHWSLIEQAGSEDKDNNQALIGLLLNLYWKPVYCYLRRKGHENEQAKDLTQGFFHEVVLGRDLLKRTDRSGGRFRSFLLVALSRYVIDIKREELASKRIPKDRLIPLDMVEPPELPQTLGQPVAEDAFNYAWVSALLEQVLEDLEAECQKDGKSLHWNVFRDRVLQPIMSRKESPSLREICDKYGIEDDTKASNMIVTVKRRFQAALRKHLRHSVVSDEYINDEFKELRKFFPKMAQDDK